MYEVQSPPKRENVMLASALTILSVLFTMTHVYHKVPLIFFVRVYLIWFHSSSNVLLKFFVRVKLVPVMPPSKGGFHEKK